MPTLSPNQVKKGISAVGILLVLFVIFVCGIVGCNSIAPGHVGIVVSKTGSSRGVQDVTMKTGWVWVNPITHTVIEYPVYMQTVKWTASVDEGKKGIDESVTFTTNNSATVNCDIAVSYQLDYSHAPQFYVTFRADRIESFTDGYFHNVVRNEVNDIGGTYPVEEIMGNNGPMLRKIQDAVQADLTKYGVQISNLGIIGACRPPKVVTDSINAKLGAQQLALQKQNEIIQEQAEAKKAEARAEGVRQSNVIMAQGDAEANKLRNESLTPALIEWNKVNRWDGHNPSVVAGSGGGIIVQAK